MNTLKSAFELLTDDPIEIAKLERKSNLMIEVVDLIQSDHIKNNSNIGSDLGKILGTNITGVIDVISGEISAVTIQELLAYKEKLEKIIELTGEK